MNFYLYIAAGCYLDSYVNTLEMEMRER